MRLWIGLALIAFCAETSLAQFDDYDWFGISDADYQSSEDQYKVSVENKGDEDFGREQVDCGNENEEKVSSDTENFYKSLENIENKPDESILNDYQMEDNRSETKNEQNIELFDKQKDKANASAEENENPDVNLINLGIDADFNNFPAQKVKNQRDDDNMYDINENSNAELLDNSSWQDLIFEAKDDKNSVLEEDMEKNISDENNQDLVIRSNDENKQLDTVNVAQNVQDSIQSIEQNELVKALTHEFVDSENAGDELAEKTEKLNVNFDDVLQNFDSEKFDEEVEKSNKSDIEQTNDEYESDTKNEFEMLRQFLQNDDINNDDQIVEDNFDIESESNDNSENFDKEVEDDIDSKSETNNDEEVDKSNENDEEQHNGEDEFEIMKQHGQNDETNNDDGTVEDNIDSETESNDNSKNFNKNGEKSNESDKEQPNDENESDAIDDSEDQLDQNNDINTEKQIVEDNFNSKSDNNHDKNEQISNGYEQIVRRKFATDESYDNEETVYKNNDLDDDLENLFETWEKLQEDTTIEADDNDNILDYEEKYNKPYREGNILSQREYDDYALDIDNDNMTSSDLDNINEEGEKINTYSIIYQKLKYYEDTAISPDMSSILENENSSEGLIKNNGLKVSSTASDHADEREKEDEIESSITMPANYFKYENTGKYVLDSDDYDDQKSTFKTVDIDNRTPEQYKDLMKQFGIVYSEDLDTESGDKVAPIHMIITSDKAVVVESPDYPNNYPTNNVIDYFFDGLGSGIEFNITDFSVNGILGDYLLVKPGGIDASGTDGLVFSYHLNEKKQYRFLDVDSLFVRFFAHPGPAIFKGYQFSVRMISPPNEVEELQPEPEPLLPPPAYLTVTLGGSSLEDFAAIQEDFRLLIADMATMYINANNVDIGLNTTSETAQITKTSLCNINWPGYESCVAVTFGVPLVYEDDQPTRLNQEDLRTMWDIYAQRDPFASRLRRMGITEFASPYDRRVLTVWLVIGAGVLISVVMLALALWRFSCFEDYTRMAAYSDTDSINEKRVLDMYPTPHQTFPALYGEQQLKWDNEKFDDTTRVDMGGYANKSYARDELMDMDSDEDIITTPRDRNSFSPRDIYQV